jgi:hypothetical protein
MNLKNPAALAAAMRGDFANAIAASAPGGTLEEWMKQAMYLADRYAQSEFVRGVNRRAPSDHEPERDALAAHLQQRPLTGREATRLLPPAIKEEADRIEFLLARGRMSGTLAFTKMRELLNRVAADVAPSHCTLEQNGEQRCNKQCAVCVDGVGEVGRGE